MKKKQTLTVTMKRYSRFLTGLFLILVLGVSVVKAETSPSELEELVYSEEDRDLFMESVWEDSSYSAILYNNTNGMPTSEANDIVETKEGFIWIGTYGGLIRYDGENFERMSAAAGITSVKCLYVDTRDRLWIGTNESGVTLMEHGKVHKWGEEDGLPASSVRDILEDENGLIYVATTGGVSVIDSDLNLYSLVDSRIRDSFMIHLEIDGDNIVYAVTNAGDIMLMRDGGLVRYIRRENYSVHGVGYLFPDPENPGYFIIGSQNGEIYYGKLDDSYEELAPLDFSPLTMVQELNYVDDRIWVCARDGIGTLDETGFHLLKNAPMNNAVDHMIKDYEGNLWFVSSRQGVMKIVRNQFTDINHLYSIGNQVVNTTCMVDDLLFVGTDYGLVILNDEDVVNTLPLTKAKTASGLDLETDDLVSFLKGCRIRSIIRDSKDRVWISTWRGKGLLCYEKGELTAYTLEEGMFSDRVRTICERRDGSVLVANSGGVSVIRDGQVVRGYTAVNGIENTEILTIAEAPNGDMVLGSDGGGIYVYNGSLIKHLGKADGLTSEAVMRIKYDPKREVFWIVTGNSLAYMTTDYQITNLDNFPYFNNFDLYENSEGKMWVLGSNGIYVVPTDELLANGEIHAAHYDMTNGLPYIPTSNSYSELTPENELYISGISGIAKVNIDTFSMNITDIKVSVPYLDADGKRIYPDRNGSFTVPSKAQRLTIYGFVFNYSLIDPLVSYQLKGFDKESFTVNRSDFMPVVYTNLPGGTYDFTMELQNLMGGSNKTVSFRIVKEKAVYEHPLFYVLAGLAAALILIWIVRLYFRRKIAMLEKKHQEEAERQRIGAELQMASQIQTSMLPHQFPPFPDRNEFDIYATMDPAKEVGGDFYDFFMIDDDHLCLVIADVSGKGIPAALVMMISMAILRSYARMGIKPAEILSKTNNAFCSTNQVDMFVTVWLGILEISTGTVTAANAGHEYPAVNKDGHFELLKDKHGFVIGGMNGIKYKDYEINLKPGDQLFVYTDGVPESTDAENHMFGTEKMIQALNTEEADKPERILENVRKAVDDFVKEAEQFDDLTMLCLTYKGTQEE